MAGISSDYSLESVEASSSVDTSDTNADSAPTIWLCREPVGLEKVVEGAESASPEWLTDYEQATVAKFSGPRRREYLSSRWLIRQAIANNAHCPPSGCVPVAGRPIASESPPGWQLSLSHSQRLSGCAVSGRRGLGLDIEPLNRHQQWQKVVRRWFSPAEQAWLLANDSHEDFLRVWTLKEAWLKATERGIAGNLQTLEVLPDYRLKGDRAEPGWQAASGRIAGFLVTLVYHQAQFVPPRGHLLAEVPANLDLDQPCAVADTLALTWHQAICPTDNPEEA